MRSYYYPLPNRYALAQSGVRYTYKLKRTDNVLLFVATKPVFRRSCSLTLRSSRGKAVSSSDVLDFSAFYCAWLFSAS